MKLRNLKSLEMNFRINLIWWVRLFRLLIQKNTYDKILNKPYVYVNFTIGFLLFVLLRKLICKIKMHYFFTKQSNNITHQLYCIISANFI